MFKANEANDLPYKFWAAEQQEVGVRNLKMTSNYENVYDVLHEIYQRYRRQYQENFDSKQMCCMWSTADPPDIIEGTDPIYDIEDAFDITIDDMALELYDMDLDEAARQILEMMRG